MRRRLGPPDLPRVGRPLLGALSVALGLSGMPLAIGLARVATVGAFAVLAAPRARADDDETRAKFLAGPEDVRASILKGLEGRPAQVGSILGPVLRDRTARAAAAQAVAWLLDAAAGNGAAGNGATGSGAAGSGATGNGSSGGGASGAGATGPGTTGSGAQAGGASGAGAPSPAPKEVPILLDEEILLCVRDDVRFVEEVRARLSPTGPGLSGLAAAARRRLDDPKARPELRAAAAWFLRFDPTAPSVRSLVEAWASGTPELLDVVGDGLLALLSFRFENPEAARKFVSEHEKQPFVDWLRDLSASKDRPDALMYRRLVAEARANIDRAKTFEDLYGYFERTQNPWPEIRRLAAKKAAKVEGSGDAWIHVLEDAVAGETDRETLAALLEVAGRLREGADERTYGLARAAAERLGSCCHAPEVQKGLLGVLGRVGSAEDVKGAYETLRKREVSDAGVLEAWLSAAGSVGGNDLEICEFHRQRLPKADDDTVRLRVRALEALAQGATAPGASWSNVAVASTYLRGILRRDDLREEERSLPRESDPQCRMAAVRSLEGFPSPETAARLHALVEVPPETPALARLAVSVLGKLAPRSTDAAQALIDVAHSRGDPEVRIEAVRDLVRVAANADPDVRAAVQKVLEDSLRADAGPFALRVAAAEASAAVAEAGVLEFDGALPGVLALVLEASRQPGPSVPPAPPAVAPDALGEAAQRLVRALATAGEKHDAEVIGGLARLGADGALETAIRLADAAADAGAGRTGLQALRAGLYVRRARLDGRDAAARRADLGEAHKILRSVTRASEVGDPRSSALAPILALHQDVVLLLLGDPEVKNGVRRSALLAALDLVTRRRDASQLAVAKGLLAEARALPDLTGDERVLLDRASAELDRMTAAPTPAPGPK